MKTNYDGCNKKVMNSLKKGEHIKCRCFCINGQFVTKTIIAYVNDKKLKQKYYRSSEGIGFNKVEPIEDKINEKLLRIFLANSISLGEIKVPFVSGVSLEDCEEGFINSKREININVKQGEKQMLENVKEGQWIWTIQNGWDKVKSINIKQRHSIVTEEGEPYLLNGKTEKEDFHPSAFLCNPFDINDNPPIDFKEGEIIAVRDSVMSN